MSVVHASGKGRRWLSSGHPWLYRDDVQKHDAEPGALVTVLDPQGGVLGHGLFSASSRIAVRMVTRARAAPDADFWRARVRRALALRAERGLLDPRGACRLIAGDAEGIPGLIVDRYARVLVVQSGTLGADRLRDEILDAIAAELGFELACVFERSDSSARKLEGLAEQSGVLRGALPVQLLVCEDGLEYSVDVVHGHKTGHYLDQRDNQKRAARSCHGRRVLDAFCYDGLFGVRAALAGAREVVCVDQSEPALERARENAARNGVVERMRFERANCMHDLRDRAAAGDVFDVVIVDPPAFAKNRAQVAGAERGYVELNRRAFALIEDGWLVSASCSYNVRAADFLDYLARAAHLAGREARLDELCGAGSDHPHLLNLPETNYLKCAFVRTLRAS
jgi:23S rRNA (cytosine1962-C5)-methyltransferase